MAWGLLSLKLSSISCLYALFASVMPLCNLALALLYPALFPDCSDVSLALSSSHLAIEPGLLVREDTDLFFSGYSIRAKAEVGKDCGGAVLNVWMFKDLP